MKFFHGVLYDLSWPASFSMQLPQYSTLLQCLSCCISSLINPLNSLPLHFSLYLYGGRDVKCQVEQRNSLGGNIANWKRTTIVPFPFFRILFEADGILFKPDEALEIIITFCCGLPWEDSAWICFIHNGLCCRCIHSMNMRWTILECVTTRNITRSLGRSWHASTIFYLINKIFMGNFRVFLVNILSEGG